MTAKEFLQQVKKIDLIIERKQAERIHFEESAMNISSPMGGDKVKSTPNPHRTADNIDAYSDIDREIEQLKQERKHILSVIEQLSFIEYDVLYKIYVEDYSLSEVAYLNKKSYSWASGNHSRALKNVQTVIDCEKV